MSEQQIPANNSSNRTKKPFSSNRNQSSSFGNNNHRLQHSSETKSAIEPKHTLAFEQLQEKFKNPEEVKQKVRQQRRRNWEDRKNMFNQPSNSIIMKGLSNMATEEEISSFVFRVHGLTATRVRIVRDKATGQSRGFGFIDFATIDESRSLMDTTDGGMFIGNDYVELEFSHKSPHKPHSESDDPKGDSYKDWICGHVSINCIICLKGHQCKTRNFMHRQSCFGCSAPKDELAHDVPASKDEKHFDQSGPSEELAPTVELIIRSLNILTTETTLLNVFSQFAPVKACRVIKDRVTQISRQFGFVEFYTVEEASQVLSQCSDLLIDGVRVNVTFAKRQHIASESEPSEDSGLAQWSSLYSYTGTDENLEEKKKKIEKQDNSQVHSTESLSQCGFIYDETTGYYYNSQLNYYYDTNTGYYYDCTAGVWMYYDEEKKTYISFPQEGTTEPTATDASTNDSPSHSEKIIGPSLPPSMESSSTTDDTEATEVVEVISSGGFVPNPQYSEKIKKLEDDINSELVKTELEEKLYSKPKQPTVKRKREAQPSTEQTAAALEKKEIGDDNVGKKMLEKLGWTKGEGLGKNRSGITAPISAKTFEKNTGLGFAKSNVGAFPPTKKKKENYHKEGMKVLQKRFNEMENEEKDPKE